MGVILPYLIKDIEQEDAPPAGFHFPEFHNANEGPLGFIGSGIDLINNIIGHATGSTQAQIQAQQAQAAAMQAAAAAAEARKGTAIKVALVIGGTAVLITGGVLLFRFYQKRKRA